MQIKSKRIEPQLNYSRLLKREFLYLATHKCKAHGIRYIQHPQCFFREKPLDSPLHFKVGFLDIESSNLQASFGYVISYCIKQMDGKLITRCVTPDDIHNGMFDKGILKNFYDDAMRFDRLAVYWGKDRRHDLPFLRTRALKTNNSFPLYGDVQVVDLYDWAKAKLSLHRYRLGTVCDELGIPAKQHPLDGDTWVKAMAGNKKALNYILEHNKEDVICLEPLYKILDPYMRRMKLSI